MRPETVEQYAKALKAGQKYYRAAVARGGYPYLPVLDEFLDENSIAARMDLGVISQERRAHHRPGGQLHAPAAGGQ